MFIVIINRSLGHKLSKEERIKLNKEINKKEGDYMLAVEEMVIRENRMLIAKGKREGRKLRI